MVPTVVLTKSKVVLITAVRPVTTAVPKTNVARPRHAKTIVTKPYSPPRRHINHSPSPKISNFLPKITAAKAPMGNPHHALKDKGVIDSGCSRHITGNMSYLSDFEELNSGYVAFGGNPKGELEDITYSDDQEDVGAEADLTNLETTITRGKIDQTLFIKTQQGDILLVQIYVDDIIFGSTNKDLCKAFEKLMKDKFQISSMGELTFFLGPQVKQKPNGIFISQDKYVAEIIRKFGLTDGKSASTPINTEKPLLKDPDGEDVDLDTYRSMIGSLMYFTSSRPYIMFAVNEVTRLQSLVDKKKVVITEATIRDALQLANPEGKGFYVADTPLFEGMLVTQEVGKGATGVNVEDVLGAGVATKGVAAESAASVADDDINAADDEPSIPSPTPPTQSPPPSQNIPSTSQDTEMLMDLLHTLLDTCTTLTRRVENLEKDKIAQALEINELKQRVKKLEIKNKLKVFKLRRLKKVGTTQRIDTSDDTIIDDCSYLGEASATITAADTLIPPATITAATSTLTITLSAAKKRKGVVIRDPEKTFTLSTIIHTEPKSKDKGKGIMVHEPKPLKKKTQIEQEEAYARELEAELNNNIDWDEVLDEVKRKEKEDNAVMRYQALKRKPQTKAQPRKNMMIYLKNMVGFKMDYFRGMSYDDIRPIFEKYFNSNVAFLEKTKEQMDEEDSKALKRISESQENKAAKRQKLDEEVKELRRHLQIVPNNEDDVYTKATPLSLKVPIVDYEIYTEHNKPYYKIKRTDGSHQLYLSFLSILRNFDREDLEALWTLVKE
nr:hypothetical protein [Tanacetum cinerariifolium]